MRRGYQKGSLKIHRANWVDQWWENGHRRNKVLGPVVKMSSFRTCGHSVGCEQPKSKLRHF
jgi:hypothetical protein